MPRTSAALKIEQPVKVSRRERAIDKSVPIPSTPSVVPLPVEALERGRANDRTQPIPVPPGLIATSAEAAQALVQRAHRFQLMRRAAIEGQSMNDRRTDSLIASLIGYIPPPPTEGKQDKTTKKENKAVFKQAKEIRAHIEKTGLCPNTIGQHWEEDERIDFVISVHNAATARSTWDDQRKTYEKRLEETAKKLPVYRWWKAIAGAGAPGLGILIAEAASLADKTEPHGHRWSIGEYRSVSGLWKRMGLAVINGRRQRRVTDPAEALLHGYVPRRRAECWTLADSMLKHQVRGELRSAKDAILALPEAMTECSKRGIENVDKEKNIDALIPVLEMFDLSYGRHALGPYGEIYIRRRAHTEVRITMTADLSHKDPEKWTLKRCDNDAKRVMFKALLKDLWVEWRRCDRLIRDAAD